MFLDISEKQYDADRPNYMGSHSLMDFSRCPYGYHRNAGGHTDTSAFTLGTATHVLILEGDKAFSERYILSDGPINEKTGKAFGNDTKKHKEWLSEQPKPIISFQDMGVMASMRYGIKTNEIASKMINDPEKQVECVIRQDFDRVKCQSKIDLYSPEFGIVDLKTTKDIKWFESDAKKYGYYFQMAFYWHMMWLLTGKSVPVYIIAVEKVEPYRCGVYNISERVLKEAHKHNQKNINFYSKCLADDVWPTLYEKMRFVESLF